MHQSRTKIAKGALMIAPLLILGLGLPAPRAPAADSPPAAGVERNGQHDFDFLFGRWKVHLKRNVTGTDRWTESDGYGIYREVWGGRANLNESFTENPNDLKGLTVRTYNGATHLWSVYWANSRDGILSSAHVGKFDHGQGEFYAQDNSDGKGTLLRSVWSKITPTSAHFEQALSEDGGRSWKVNSISDMVRIGDVEEPTSSDAGTAGEQPGQRDFEPLLGRWSFHLKVRLKPGSTQWIDYTGPGECIPLWHGRAQLDTINLEGPTKHIEGLTVRLFNPKTREWRLYWANSRDGLVVVPQIGQFKAGHGEFYAQDQDADDKTILNKFDWSAMMSKPHFEQSFSIDGGKNWEVNWIADQTRVN
ncbi:MAG TPA: hypothetical protein VIY68_13930 [Steroidobacteraceae bacterium]